MGFWVTGCEPFPARKVCADLAERMPDNAKVYRDIGENLLNDPIGKRVYPKTGKVESGIKYRRLDRYTTRVFGN